MTDLRARNHESTRRTILDATQHLFAEVHGWTLTMDEIAERAGVSRRTLYRYFPTREDLFEEASREWSEDLGNDPRAGVVTDLESFAGYLADQWTRLADNLPAVIAQHQSAAGRELRQRWLAIARRMAGDLIESDTGGNLGISDELVDVCVAMSSSSMFLELVDRMERDPEKAARMVVWAIGAILQHADDGAPAPLFSEPE